MMGSPLNEPGRFDDEAQKHVQVAPFSVGKYLVTRGEWAAFVKASGREALGLQRQVLDANGLSPTAGMAFGQVAHPSAAAIARLETTPPSQPAPSQPPRPQGRTPTAEELAQALQQHEGNVARTARALGVHRTQLRRWLERYAIDSGRFAPPGVPTIEE